MQKKRKSRAEEFDKVDVDTVFQSNKYQQLPAIPVVPLQNQHVIELFGPDQNSTPVFSGDYVYCKSISTYPRQRSRVVGVKGPRIGDPNCDCYGVQVYPNRTIVAVADGCNWGEEPREAARLACATFLEYMKSKLNSIHTLREAGHFLLRAFSHAHTKILESPRSARDVYDSGTTTLLGGLLLQLTEEEAKKQPGGYSWVFVCANVGDCKAFLYSPSSKQVTDITRGNRPRSNDVRDPGGRLGPYIGPKGGPDLRNLGLFMTLCEQDSLVFVLSDGVHDNLDPENLGLTPADMGLNLQKWDPSSKKVEKVKDAFRTKCLGKKVMGSEEEVLTPELAATRLLQHCKKTTQHSRRWMQENPARRIPEDHTKFRGKMDHSTCVVLTVGSRDLEAQSVGKKSLEEQGTIKLPRDVALSFYGGSKGGNATARPTSSIQVCMSETDKQIRLVCRAIYVDALRWMISDRGGVQLTIQPPALDPGKLPGEGFVPLLEDEFSHQISRLVPLPCSVAGPSSGTATALDAYTAVIILEKK